jgi:hypothetical protein
MGWLKGVMAVMTPSSGVDPALAAVRGDVTGEDLPIVAQALVGTEHEHVGHAARLIGAVLHGQPALGGDERGNLRHTLAHDSRGLVQDVGPVKAAQAGLVGLCNAKGLAHLFQAGLGHRTHHRVGEGVEDFDVAVTSHLLAGDAQLLLDHGRGLPGT